MFKRVCEYCNRPYRPNSNLTKNICLVCGKKLCENCNNSGFCPAHWSMLPNPLKSSMQNIVENVKRNFMLGFFLIFLCMVGVMITFVLLAVNGNVFVGLGIFFGGFILMAGIMMSIVMAPRKVPERQMQLLRNANFPIDDLRAQSLITSPFGAQSNIPNPMNSGIPINSMNKTNFANNPTSIQTSINPGTPSKKKYCEYCGAENEFNSLKCIECGSPFK